MSESSLLTPLTVGDQILPNRIVLSSSASQPRPSTWPSFNDDDEQAALQRMVAYYLERTTCGLMITDGFEISSTANRHCPQYYPRRMDTDHDALQWKTLLVEPLARLQKEKDPLHRTPLYCQLWHLGRAAHSSWHASALVEPTTTNGTPNTTPPPTTTTETTLLLAPSAIPIASGRVRHGRTGDLVEWETPRALTVEEMAMIRRDFCATAQRARTAGFDGIELHAGNGYLLDQFLHAATNQRTDEYGGAPAKRIQFLVSIVQALIDDGSFPAHRIGVRISPYGTTHGMGDNTVNRDDEDHRQGFLLLARALEELGIAYLNVMDGSRPASSLPGKQVTLYDLKQEFQGPIIANGGLTQQIAEGMIRTGSVDLAAFGRLFMANPNLPECFQKSLPLRKALPRNSSPGDEGVLG